MNIENRSGTKSICGNGSITLEAILSAMLAIVIFLTLAVTLHMFAVKIYLERAVRQTTDLLAQSAYAVRVYNEGELYVLESEENGVIRDKYLAFRAEAERKIVEKVIRGFTDKLPLKSERLHILKAALPQKYGIGNEALDYIEIAVKYDIPDIGIPFLKVLRSVTAAGKQKAWLTGGNADILRDIAEKALYSILEKVSDKFLNQNKGEDRNETVYITDYGTRYHRGNCSSLRKSKKSIKKSIAISEGYFPCKMCVLKVSKMIGNRYGN